MVESLGNNGLGNDKDPQETKEWKEALRAVFQAYGSDGASRVKHLLSEVGKEAQSLGIDSSYGSASGGLLTTRYKNTIDLKDQPDFPGNIDIEKIEDIIRWNTVIMVNRANRLDGSIGGHIGRRC